MKTEDWIRSYGPLGRTEFVQGLPCIAGAGRICRGKSHNHHTKSGGTGRKADCDTIVPLCFLHHNEVHANGQDTFARRHKINWELAASETEMKWQDHLQREL